MDLREVIKRCHNWSAVGDGGTCVEARYGAEKHLSPHADNILDNGDDLVGQGLVGLILIILNAVEDEVVSLVLFKVIHLLMHVLEKEEN